MNVLLTDDHDLVRDTLAAYIMRETGTEFLTTADFPTVTKWMKALSKTTCIAFLVLASSFLTPIAQANEFPTVIELTALNGTMPQVTDSSKCPML